MKRKWSLRLGAAVLCAVLLGSCGSTAAAPAESTAPADPLTGQQLLYPEQRAAAVVIENTTGSTTQWGIGSASVVLELRGGQQLERNQVDAIVHMVASSIPDLAPERVTVVDQSGRMLTIADPNSDAALNAAQFDQVRRLETSYSGRTGSSR